MQRASSGIARESGSADSRRRSRDGCNAINHRGAGASSGASFAGGTSRDGFGTVLSPASLRDRSACSEQPIARVSESGKNVPLRIELAVERRSINGHVGMTAGESSNSFGCGNDTEESNA